MKNLKQTKASLQKQLNEIAEQEDEQMRKEWYPKIKAKYLGKFFKTWNTYGGDCEGWWLYKAVTSITEEDIYDTRGNGITSYYRGWQFQVTSNGSIQVEPITFGYVHSLDKKITEAEFNSAYNKMCGKLESISKS